MTTLYDPTGHPFTLGSELARGGEAIVYHVEQRPDLLAKCYKQVHAATARKLAWMVANPPVNPPEEGDHAALAWPVGLLSNARGDFVGYLMPRIDHAVPLLEVLNPRLRAQRLPDFTRRYLHRTARNLAVSLHALHAQGYVVGDLHESNVLVTPAALVTIIDADSFQVQGEEELFHCPVGKIEYTPPELQGTNFRETIQSPEHDAFALAVLTFQLLLEGSHPFRSRWQGASEVPPMAEKIRQGWYPYDPACTLVAPPPGVNLEHLHPVLVELFARCFVAGHREPQARPHGQQWARALEQAEQQLITCDQGHDYASHLEACPACQRYIARVQRRPDKAAARAASMATAGSIPQAPGTASARSWEQALPTLARSLTTASDDTMRRVSQVLIFVLAVLWLLSGHIMALFIAIAMDSFFNQVFDVKDSIRLVWRNLYPPAAHFDNKSHTTQGHVIDRREVQKGKRRGGRTEYQVRYVFTGQYRRDGRRETVVLADEVSAKFYAQLYIGDPVTVRYMPDDVQMACLDKPTKHSPGVGEAILILFIIIALLLGFLRLSAVIGFGF